MARRPDISSLVAGLALIALGSVLLLASTGAFDMSFEVFAPIACAATGAMLLASGLTRSG